MLALSDNLYCVSLATQTGIGSHNWVFLVTFWNQISELLCSTALQAKSASLAKGSPDWNSTAKLPAVVKGFLWGWWLVYFSSPECEPQPYPTPECKQRVSCLRTVRTTSVSLIQILLEQNHRPSFNELEYKTQNGHWNIPTEIPLNNKVFVSYHLVITALHNYNVLITQSYKQ